MMNAPPTPRPLNGCEREVQKMYDDLRATNPASIAEDAMLALTLGLSAFPGSISAEFVATLSMGTLRLEGATLVEVSD